MRCVGLTEQFVINMDLGKRIIFRQGQDSSKQKPIYRGSQILASFVNFSCV